MYNKLKTVAEYMYNLSDHSTFGDYTYSRTFHGYKLWNKKKNIGLTVRHKSIFEHSHSKHLLSLLTSDLEKNMVYLNSHLMDKEYYSTFTLKSPTTQYQLDKYIKSSSDNNFQYYLMCPELEELITFNQEMDKLNMDDIYSIFVNKKVLDDLDLLIMEMSK